MRGVLLAALSAVLAALSVVAPANAADDPYRPAYHYTSAANFMNDPNGLIYKDGTYHLFYQHNPYGATAGNGSWGHATSTDMVHWKERPIAIMSDAKEDVWSGSVVNDVTNSSGFGTKDNPPLVAVYTSFRKSDGVQRQALAYSLDDGATFTKYAGNPVLDIGSHDFRDPKVFWDGASASWRMVVAKSVERKVGIYSSHDLKTWSHRSDFGPAGVTSGVWECPDLFPLAVDGNPADTRWVLTVSSAGKVQYFVGAFDGATFTSPDAAAYTPPAGTTLQDFEGNDYGSWTTTGAAFGSGPSHFTTGDVQGFHGSGYADSWGGDDANKGTLTSPAFTVDQGHLNFLIGGGNHPHVDGGSDGPPPGTTLADFEGSTLPEGWTGTGDFTAITPTRETLPGQLGAQVLDTCQAGCDEATGTVTSRSFTITDDYVDLLVAGGNHPMSGTNPTAVNLVVDGQVVRSASGKNSPNMDWVAWNVADLKGRTAQLQVVDQRTSDWGHLMVDNIVLSPVAAAPWNAETTANLLVDGKVVRTATGTDSPTLDWASWDVADLRGKQARIQLIDNAVGGWGHLYADDFLLSSVATQDMWGRARLVDRGADYYAAVTYNDLPNGRRVQLGWMGSWDYANDTPTGAWRGEQSVPRELSLRTVGGKVSLVQSPISELDSLAGKPVRLDGTTAVRPVTVTAGTTPVPASGRSLRLDATFTAATAPEFGVDVRVGTGDGQRTRIGYDVDAGELFLDRTKSGDVGFSAAFSRIDRVKVPLQNGKLRLKVYVDSSSVEVFANGGIASLTDLVFPATSSTGIDVFSTSGSTRVDSLTVRQLGSSISR
ncbi:GH32 C-terminal domain-containing protein [Pedococcus sp. 5OH_020]|uniref:GH32 C-terminal domain-containing protein n=1 Tax=Pedococcus sp. 5OH_020 TaxID=2989814 RepID=UPI0022E9BB51|nr:GH32 C-terminal domain-containing protein [Pedococcus sp. 5OH_020]